jgi:hypothetical protein
VHGDPELWRLSAKYIAIGVPFLGVFYLAWSGRSLRTLFRQPYIGPVIVTLVPTTGLFLVVLAVVFAFPFLLPVGLVVITVTVPLGIFAFATVSSMNPTWAHPRWYREELAQYGDDYNPRAAFKATIRPPQRPPDADGALSQQAAVLLTDDADRPTLQSRPYGRDGRLWLFPNKLVFIQSHVETVTREDIVYIDIPFREVQQVRVRAPERNAQTLLRLLSADARGRRMFPMLEVIVKRGESYSFAVAQPHNIATLVTSSGELS